MKHHRAKKDILILLMLLIIVRGWVLISALEEVTANDELDTGLLFTRLSGPPILPLCEYWNPRRDASAVYQILALLFYLILGDGLISLKVMSLVIGAVILVLLYKVVSYIEGRDAALWAALFFIFAPPSYIKASLIVLGDYYASFIFTLLAVYLLLWLIKDREGRVRNRDSFLLGAILGLAVFFNHISLVTFFCITFLFLTHYHVRRGNLRILASWSWGVAAGVLPMVIMLFIRGPERAFSIYGVSAWRHIIFDIPRALNRLMKLLAYDFPASLRFHAVGPISGGVLAWTWYVIAGLAVLATVGLNRRKLVLLLRGIFPMERWKAPKEAITLETSMVVFMGLFFISYAFTDFQFEPWRDYGYRYLMIIYPAIFILIAIQIGRLAKKLPALATIIKGMVIIPCCLALAWPAAVGEPLRILRYDGISFHGLALNAVFIWKDEIRKNLRRSVDKMDEALRPAFLMPFATAYYNDTSFELALRLAQEALPPQDRIHFYRGLILLPPNMHIREPERAVGMIHQFVEPQHRHLFYSWLSEGIIYWDVGPEALRPLLNIVSKTKERECRDFLLEVIGASVVTGNEQKSIQDIHNELSMLLKNDPEKKAWAGIGAKYASVHGYGVALSHQFLNSISDPLARRQFLSGIADVMRNDQRIALQPWHWARGIMRRIPHDLRRTFLSSIGNATQMYTDRSPYWLAYEIRQVLQEEDMISICEGIGRSVAEHSKTFNDYLRWFINWDCYMGRGCSEAFRRGLMEGLEDIYQGSPGFMHSLTERLGLKENLKKCD